MKKNSSTPFLSLQLFLVIFLGFFSAYSQQLPEGVTLDSVFCKYTKPYQEVMYAHINKTKFIAGESLGYTVYAFNKKEKVLSSTTSNIYCVVTDKDNTVVKEQMVKATNGIASGSFSIDDSFQKGTYNLKVYTNWMLNFSAKNIFVAPFEVLNVGNSLNGQRVTKSNKLDIQFLPESGHFLNGIMNTVGVIAKDSSGFGVANLKGRIVDSDKNLITNFSLNELGIGRFSFSPDKSKNYKAEIIVNGKNKTYTIVKNIKSLGVLLQVQPASRTNVTVTVATNKSTLSSLKGKNYSLTIHNGKTLGTLPVKFTDAQEINFKIPLQSLTKGVNVFTIFNDKNKPVAERLFFNYEGIHVKKSEIESIITLKDTTSINLRYKDLNTKDFNNVSVSVLPKKTKSYTNTKSMIAQVLLEPYVKGVIENPNYYFKDINDEKKLHLDNLLITQGWSSYSWFDIFNNTNTLNYAFEEGISVKFNIPENTKESKFIVHKLENSDTQFLDFKEEIKSFTIDDFYPENKEELLISKLKKSGRLMPTPVYAQFNPPAIPSIKNRVLFDNKKPSYFADENLVEVNRFITQNNIEVLDEITIKANKERQRIEAIKKSAIGRVKFLRDHERTTTLANYLNFQAGIIARDNPNTGTLQVYNKSAGGVPAILLNDSFVYDYGFYYYYYLDYVEYIIINSLEMGPNANGLRGGTIRIYENYEKFRGRKDTYTKIKFPVTFTQAKSFYIPDYENYNSNFYKNYGVVDWLPINNINSKGNLKLSFNSKNVKGVKLFIEGITNSGDFILEEKTISVN